ncbi:response regulator [Myxococcota bacterium]|nr:response regulator [Myxococcota bacterium]
MNENLDLAKDIAALARLAADPKSLEQSIEMALLLMRDATGYDKGMALSAGPDKRPRIVSSYGLDDEWLDYIANHYMSLRGMDAVRDSATLVISDLQAESIPDEILKLRQDMDVRALFVIPIKGEDERGMAAFVFYHSEKQTPSDAVLKYCETLATFMREVLIRVHLQETKQELIQQSLEGEGNHIVASLAAGVAHDFNNLLGAMLGFVHLAPRLERAELSELCSRLQIQIQEASGLSRSFVDLARGIMKRTVEGQAELVTTIRSAIDLAAVTSKKNVTYEFSPKDEALWAQIDGVALTRILLNLLLNATQALASTPDAKVEVRVSRENKTLIVDIDDNGPGIDKKEEERVFQPFVSLEDTVGTGLGLASARGIVERLGGSLKLWHREGPGACFRLTLPQFVRAGESASDSSPDDSSEQALRFRGRALVVEDDETQRELFESILQQYGFETDGVGDGEQALSQIAAADYSLMLLDQAMPKLTGIEVLSQMRAAKNTIPVIMISGYGISAAMAGDRIDNYTIVLTKPIDVDELLGAIKRLNIGVERAST